MKHIKKTLISIVEDLPNVLLVLFVFFCVSRLEPHIEKMIRSDILWQNCAAWSIVAATALFIYWYYSRQEKDSIRNPIEDESFTLLSWKECGTEIVIFFKLLEQRPAAMTLNPKDYDFLVLFDTDCPEKGPAYFRHKPGDKRLTLMWEQKRVPA